MTPLAALAATRDPIAQFLLAMRDEWSALSTARPNILLVGDKPETSAAVSAMQTIHRLPVLVRNCGDSPLTLPSTRSVGTLILHDVAALSLEQQCVLCDWLDHERRTAQIVSTSKVALFPLTKSGAFLEALYYRLNVVYVETTVTATRCIANQGERV